MFFSILSIPSSSSSQLLGQCCGLLRRAGEQALAVQEISCRSKGLLRPSWSLNCRDADTSQHEKMTWLSFRRYKMHKTITEAAAAFLMRHHDGDGSKWWLHSQQRGSQVTTVWIRFIKTAYQNIEPYWTASVAPLSALLITHAEHTLG
jgi:hypothetical protein